MTINVCVKVNEGVVLASDSTTTLSDANGAWVNSYDHANKMLCLRKGLPIGMQTCGLGNIGAHSIASLGKEFRRRITSEGEHHVDSRNYSMEQVSKAFGSFLKERYDKAFSDPNTSPLLIVRIAGYSTDAEDSEVWEIVLNGPTGLSVRCASGQGGSTVLSSGQPEWIYRLLSGYAPELALALSRAGFEDALKDRVMASLGPLQAPVLSEAMPIQDAIDLAEFLVEVSGKMSRFCSGHKTIGGPTEIAAITKYEGFRWVKRKHYFTAQLNPDDYNGI